MRTFSVWLGLLVVAAGFCSPMPAQSAASAGHFLELWGKAWDMHDVDAMVRLHADDCVTVNRFGVTAAGKDEIRRSLLWLHNGPFRNSHFSVPKLVDQRRIAPGLIALHASWRSPSGKANPPEEELLVTLLLKEFAGEGWLAEEVNIHAVEPLTQTAAEPLAKR